jgi:hypothetical protein
MGFLKQASLRWSPTFWQQTYCWRSSYAIQVSKYLPDYRRVFDAGNDVQGCTNAAKRRDARERRL